MNNCYTTTKKLLNLLNIKYTPKYLKDTLLSHPDYNSLLSISDTLDKYQIESLALKIDWMKIKEVPLPCIVQIKEDDNDSLYIITSIFEDTVLCFNEKNKLIKLPKEKFLKIWTGVCLLIEVSEESEEIDIHKKLNYKRIFNLLKVSIIILFTSWIVINFLNSELITTNKWYITYSALLIILKIIGLGIGSLLLWFEVDKNNPTLQNFCSGNNKKINCNSVLSSKYSKLFNGTLSISTLGFSYFFGTFLFLLINSFSLTSLSVSGILSLVSIPLVAASIYYQAIVIKQWCKFCLIIQAILVAEVAITFLAKFYLSKIETETLPVLFLLLLIPILGWELIKPLLEKEKEINIYKRKLRIIKNNPDIFESLLIKSRKLKTSTKGLGLSLSNNSDTQKYFVIKICSPYCPPCSKSHPILEDLVNAGKINLQILYTASSNKDKIGKAVSHFLAIDELSKNKTQQALDDWYLEDQKNYDVFAAKYPIDEMLLQKQNDKIKEMHNWCNLEKIAHTPTIFINGFELPKEYNVEDLKDILR